MRAVFPAADESLNTASAFIEEELVKAGCPIKIQMKILVAFEELFVNVAHYAYGDQTGEVTVDIETAGGDCILTLIDTGTPFNPLEREDPDITESAQDRQIGGLGILMVKKMMDHVEYEYAGGRNIIRIKHGIRI